MSKSGLATNIARFNAQNRNRFYINLDWLQMHVQSQNGRRFEEFETPYFKVQRTGQTKVFKSVYEITYKKHNRVMATYATDALEQIMPAGHGLLKIDNYYLYHAAIRMRTFTEWLLRRLYLEFIGITRLDISYDFNSFYNNRNPENFIKSFLRDDIVKLQNSKFYLSGEHTTKNRYNQISFGAKSSAVNYKLYNKTQEMRDKVFKTHIFEQWKRSSTLDLNKDIWRLEFTINSNTNLLLSERGNLKFHSLDTLNLDVFAGAFKYLYDTYFDFRKRDANQSRKDRMQPVKLLDLPDIFSTVKIHKINPLKKSHDRSTKIFIKKLNAHQNELRGRDDDFVGDAREIVSKLVSVYGLQNWAKKKGIEFDDTNYVDDLADSAGAANNALLNAYKKQMQYET